MSRVSPDAPQDRPLTDPQDAVQRDRPQDAPRQPADSAPAPTRTETALLTRPEWGTVLFTWALTAGVILVAVLFAAGVVFVLSTNPHHYPPAPLRW